MLHAPSPRRPLFRADLHVHSRHSPFPHFRKLGIRSCYSDPVAIYRTAKRRGMDLVTITDHNTIDGCLEVMDRLDAPPDFLISEEVGSFHPGIGQTIHLTAFDIDEGRHREIQKRRGDFRDLIRYLRREGIPASFNHFIDTFACAAPQEQILQEDLLSWFDLFEVRDGARPVSYNRVMERILWEARQGGIRKGFVGGSNAHTLRRIGTTYTASGATSREEFLDDLRNGDTLPFGADGTVLGMTADAYGVVFRYYRSLLPGGGVRLALRQRAGGAMFALLSAPLHGVAFPWIVVLLHFAWIRDRLTRIHRRLDATDILAFRERVRRFAAPGAVREPGRNREPSLPNPPPAAS